MIDAGFSVETPARPPAGRLKGHQPLANCYSANAPQANTCAPVLLRRIDPQLAPEGNPLQIEGTVVLGFTINAVGKPADVRVIESLGHGLDELAVTALQQWKYKPATYKGNPFRVSATEEIQFVCGDSPAPRR
jgi:TonB family protein